MFPPANFTCDTDTYICEVTETGESLETCQMNCDPGALYTCNQNIYQCEITTPFGDPLAVCQPGCIQPDLYTCNQSTQQCEYDPNGSPFSTCQTACDALTYTCDIQAFSCYVDEESELNLAGCEMNCQEPKWWCNQLTKQCYIWNSWWGYETLNDCIYETACTY